VGCFTLKMLKTSAKCLQHRIILCITTTMITVCLIKPSSLNQAGAILERIQHKGFTLQDVRMMHLTWQQAAQFYIIHQQQPFYEGLVNFMSSNPCLYSALAHPSKDVVSFFRICLGSTDPTKAAFGTLRAKFGTSILHNAVHGSDSSESAYHEQLTLRSFF
jgi:nucleoside-diphosphate kinase